MRLAVVLSLPTIVVALALAAALYALTRDEDPDLAIPALSTLGSSPREQAHSSWIAQNSSKAEQS